MGIGEAGMTDTIVFSVDGACSGKKAACAAVAPRDGKIVAQVSRFVRHADGYALAAELAAVGLAARLIDILDDEAVVVEVDNPDVLRVIKDGYKPKQFSRIAPGILTAAADFDRLARPTYVVLPRNSTAGLRRADRLARAQIWRRRQALTAKR